MLITNDNYLSAVEKLFKSCNIKENTLGQITRYFYGNTDDIKITPEICDIKYNNEALKEFGGLIFSFVQLKIILSRVIYFFLSSEKYNELTEIIKCCAVNSAYSDNTYKSVKENYTIDERSFDRFIEMLDATGVTVSKYIPMFLYILDAPSGAAVKVWIRPLREYFKRKNNYNHLVEYAGKYRSINGYGLLLEINSEYAVDKIADILLYTQNSKKIKYRALLADYKREAVAAVSPALKDTNISVREQAIRILLLFKTDESVFAKLTQCYIDESTSRIKNLIAGECGLKDERLKLDSFREMLDFCRDYEKAPLPRALPALCYDNGEPIDKEVYAAIISILSEQRKPLSFMIQAKEIAKFIPQEALKRVAEDFYAHINFDSDKYKLPFCVLFASDEIFEKELARQSKILGDENLNTRRLTMLGLRGGEAVKKFYYSIQNNDKYKRLSKYAYAGLELTCALYGENMDDIEDDRVNNLGFNEKCSLKTPDATVSITPKLEVQVSSKKASSAANCVEREIKLQIKRFENAMIESRKWTRQNFYKNIIGNPLLNRIASTLFFGEYKYNKLNNIFIIEEGIRLLDNTLYELIPDCEVMVAHPIELAARFNNLKINNIFQPFKQAERDYFVPAAMDISRNYVERFNSYLVDDATLIKRLKAYGWALSTPLESGAITHCTKTIAGIIGTMTFREPMYLHRESTVSIGHVKFYLQKTSVKYFAPNRSKPIDIAGMDKRVFSEFLYDISRIAKGN